MSSNCATWGCKRSLACSDRTRAVTCMRLEPLLSKIFQPRGCVAKRDACALSWSNRLSNEMSGHGYGNLNTSVQLELHSLLAEAVQDHAFHMCTV